MSGETVFGLCGAALIGLGLYGLVVRRGILRKILAFNVMGGGVFLVFGVVARRGAAAGLGADPIPQALTITGVVVAFASTALAVALARRLAEAESEASSEAGAPGEPPAGRTP